LRRLQIVELSLEFLDFRLVVLLDTSDFALQLFDLLVHRRRCLRQGRRRQHGASQTDRQSEFISQYADWQPRCPHQPSPRVGSPRRQRRPPSTYGGRAKIDERCPTAFAETTATVA